MNKNRFARLALVGYVGLLALPNFLSLGSNTPMGQLESVERMAYGAAAWVLWFAIFGRHLWLAVALSIPLFLIWWPAELYLRSQVGATVTAAFIGLLIETNRREAMDFLTVYWPWVLLGLVPIALGVWVARLTHQERLMWTHRSRVWMLILLPAVGLMTYWVFDLQQNELDKGLQFKKDAFWVEPMGYWTSKWGSIYPLDPYLAMRRYSEDTQRVQRMRKVVSAFQFGAVRQAAPAADLIVLVIGESARADRWQLGGYQRQTNPLLSRQKNLVYFSDVVTYATATRTSVPKIISRAPVVNPVGPVGKVVEPSFLKALSEVGYQTYWVSNQSASGFFDTSVVFYARDANTVLFVNPGNYGAEGSYDESLLGGLKEAISTGKPAAVVLHTLGSHFNYAHRYPASFDVFKPSIKQKEFAFSMEVVRKKEVNNAYDNSILYTDYVLSKVIDTVKASGRAAVVVYVSDHGEDIYEPGCISSGLVRNSVASYRVPALAWYSDRFEAQRPELVRHMRQMAAQPMQTDFAFQAMLDVASVTLPTTNGRPMPSFATGTVPRAPRWVAGVGDGVVDFDEALKGDHCRVARAEK